MTKAELDQWFAKGTISAACYIWQTGWPEWKSAGLVYQLSAGPTSGASASIPPPIAPSDIPDFFSDAASTAASRRNQKRAESPVSELLSGGAKLVGKEAKGFVKSFISIAVFLLVLSVGCPLVFKALNQVDSVNSAKVPLSTIGWREIDDIYNLKNHYTDLQKDEEWKKYGGKKVKWTGRVAEIHEGIFGLQLQVKMNADTFISDLIITLEDNQRSKGLKLKKEDTITFIGILDKWGTLLPITLSHGEIVDSQFESSALIGRLKAVGQIPTIAIRFRAAISRHDLYIRKWL